MVVLSVKLSVHSEISVIPLKNNSYSKLSFKKKGLDSVFLRDYVLYTYKYLLCTNQRYLHGHPQTANVNTSVKLTYKDKGE